MRDGLPAGAYDFQATLSNRARPDCVIRLPGDARLLVVDAKFPLEGFTALRAARDDETRKAAQTRVRTPTSASTSRTSPSAIFCPARRRKWR